MSTINSHSIYKLESGYIMPTYSRSKVVLEKGNGLWVFDRDRNKYLDFIGGIATCPIGHSNPVLVKAVERQVGKIINTTNLFYTEPQVLLAEKLSQLSGIKSKVFFSNSGAESVEAAIKLARKFTGKTDIIATEHSFHGRTFGALSATWKPKIREPFKPLVPGFKHIKYNNSNALKGEITSKTAAFIVEPIQGEGGITVPSNGYLKEVSDICTKRDILLIVDEIQTGLGRTGKFFAYQNEGIKPDIITLAKGLAGGIPIGVTIAKSKVADAFAKGDHGSTFGGNSLSTSAANAVVDYILKNKLMDNATVVGKYFTDKLKQLAHKYSFIKQVRGKGLMVGMELFIEGKDIVEKCLRRGLLINCCTEKVLRFLPPLTVTKKEVDICVGILDDVFSTI